MAGRLHRRDCAECGTEFVPGEAERGAALCPACRRRRKSHAAVRVEDGVVWRTEVRGHLWSPSRWPRPGAGERGRHGA